jgi:hypothetical protein
MRTITIVNQSSMVSPADLAAAVVALQLQVSQHFAAAWGIDCNLQSSTDPNVAGEKIFLLDTIDQADALGYHTLDNTDAPVGFVAVKTTEDAGDHWQSTLSHELLEQLLDPDASCVAVVSFQGKATGMAYEACDAVENDEYEINGVPVSNFLLPKWFDSGAKGPFDYMGKLAASLTMSAGGYVAFTTTLKTWRQVFAKKCPDHQRAVTHLSRRHRRGLKKTA